MCETPRANEMQQGGAAPSQRKAVRASRPESKGGDKGEPPEHGRVAPRRRKAVSASHPLPGKSSKGESPRAVPITRWVRCNVVNVVCNL